MKSKTLFAILLVATLGLYAPLSAQSLKWKSVSFDYKAYPANPLPSKVKSYAVVLKGHYANHDIFKRKLANTVKLSNFTMVEDPATADVVIDLTIQKCALKNKVQKSEQSESSTLSYFEYQFQLPTALLVHNQAKNAFFKNEKFFLEPTTITTEKVNMSGPALGIHFDDKQLELTAIDHVLSVIQKTLAMEYDQPSIYFSQYLYTAKGKKLNYDDIDQGFDHLKESLKLADIIGEPSSEQKAGLDKAIAAWQTALNEADTTNDKARVNKDVYAGLNFNLALAYGWKSDFSKAWAHLKDARRFDMGSQFARTLKDLTTWMSDHEKRWFINHPETFEATLQGSWNVTAVLTLGGLDLNKDGKRSENLLGEWDECKKYRYYRFEPGKKLSLTTGSNECEKTQVMAWRIAKNSRDDRNYLLMDNLSEDLTFSDAGAIFKFVRMTSNEFSVRGEAMVDPESDTTDEVTITFTRM